MDADGSNEVNLTPGTDSSNEQFPSVSGSLVAFSTDRNGKKECYIGTLSRDSLTHLVNMTSGISDDCWRPMIGYVDRSYFNL